MIKSMDALREATEERFAKYRYNAAHIDDLLDHIGLSFDWRKLSPMELALLCYHFGIADGKNRRRMEEVKEAHETPFDFLASCGVR